MQKEERKQAPINGIGQFNRTAVYATAVVGAAAATGAASAAVSVAAATVAGAAEAAAGIVDSAGCWLAASLLGQSREMWPACAHL
jgi:hypothetical protein